MFDIKRLSELDTYKRIWKKAKEKAAAVLRALAFGSAVLFLALNLVIAVITMILEATGQIKYVPGHIQVEWFCTALVIIGIEIVSHDGKKWEKQNEKKIEEMKINNQNWQSRFKVQMIQNIQFFRATNQLTTREEAKFIRIVNYSARELAKEIQEGKRREEESMEAEAPEKR